MNLFDVYTLWDIEPIKASGYKIWDVNGKEYLDFYGGHAVISIGHSHPIYKEMLKEQIDNIGFYSNAVINSLQKDFAERLGKICGYIDYSLFLCNSGAEANENAMKIASFHTGRKKILAVEKSFHGRTSGAVEATDNDKIKSPFNKNGNVVFTPLNDIEKVRRELFSQQYAAMIIEGIQGVAGIYVPNSNYFKEIESLCKKNGTLLIIDEIQSGYGRTGKFFAHQNFSVKADIITMAKGIANGFPMGAVILSPKIKAIKGMLGTTFGGSHLACTAAIAVLKVIENEHLIENAAKIGEYIINNLNNNKAIKEIRGIGLMIGIELNEGYENLRERLLFEKNIFTGGAGKNVIRLLPPLCVDRYAADTLINAFNDITK